MIKPCKECGVPFEAVGNARYCQEECRIARDQRADVARNKRPSRQIQMARIAKRWHKNNQEKAKADSRAYYQAKRDTELARQREYHRKKLAGELIARPCRCGATFWVPPESRRWFCTRECRYRITYAVTVWLVQTMRRLS